MSLDWKLIECAFHEWIDEKVPALGLDHIIWADQNLPQPGYPYVTLKRDAITKVNGTDETRFTTDLAQPAGQEIGLETVGVREFTLSVNAFVDEKTGSNDPNCDAMAILGLLQVSLGQLSIKEKLCLAGMSVIEELSVVDLSQVVNDEMISRAAMDVRFRAAFSCVERTGYIDTVQIDSVPCNPATPSDVDGVSITVVGI